MTEAEIQGVGLGIRQPHFQEILETKPAIPWFEALADNYLNPMGSSVLQLESIRGDYPMALHCVGMNLGSVDPVDLSYLRLVKDLSKRLEASWISDHLSWSAVSGRQHHDLLPLPFTSEAVHLVSENIMRTQDFLGERILIENASSYVTFRHSEMLEWEFLKEVSEKSDCLILLDVNNVYVNSVNHGFSALDFLKNIPHGRVKQIHLAGHDEDEFVLVDTHGSSVPEAVWDLYLESVRLIGAVPAIIERDSSIPALKNLMDEMNQVKRRVAECN
ncbi:MAG TPA: DUF692 domain-containing protein [Bacteriovoracaceae bacterium]|nr:DUF692 domain-containing protein [Bacteriovoracaceae bacterium]